jgi:methylmalonyl-CoA mutase N-terminal domain/subunit
LERLRFEAADPTVNLMPALIEAAARDVTVGESMGALETIFGTWFERSFV